MNTLDMYILSGIDLLSEEAKDLARKKLGPKKKKPRKVNEKDFLLEQGLIKFLAKARESNRKKTGEI